jgi:exosome complex RNA-binding protein Rrp42 (RNase PH superfamily)
MRAAPPPLSQVEVTMDEDDEPEVELTGDAGAPLNVTRVPVIVSVSQVGGAPSGDADAHSASPARCQQHARAQPQRMSVHMGRHSAESQFHRCHLLCRADVVGVCCVVQVGQQSVVDLSSEEEPCATAALRIAVNAAGRVMGISKAGSGGIDPTLTQVGQQH